MSMTPELTELRLVCQGVASLQLFVGHSHRGGQLELAAERRVRDSARIGADGASDSRANEAGQRVLGQCWHRRELGPG